MTILSSPVISILSSEDIRKSIIEESEKLYRWYNASKDEKNLKALSEIDLYKAAVGLIIFPKSNLIFFSAGEILQVCADIEELAEGNKEKVRDMLDGITSGLEVLLYQGKTTEVSKFISAGANLQGKQREKIENVYANCAASLGRHDRLKELVQFSAFLQKEKDPYHIKSLFSRLQSFFQSENALDSAEELLFREANLTEREAYQALIIKSSLNEVERLLKLPLKEATEGFDELLAGLIASPSYGLTFQFILLALDKVCQERNAQKALQFIEYATFQMLPDKDLQPEDRKLDPERDRRIKSLLDAALSRLAYHLVKMTSSEYRQLESRLDSFLERCNEPSFVLNSREQNSIYAKGRMSVLYDRWKSLIIEGRKRASEGDELHFPRYHPPDAARVRGRHLGRH